MSVEPAQISKSVLQDKSFLFALHIVKAYKVLIGRQEQVMSKQLLRSGTSIGANIAEAVRGQSRADFNAKMYISLKEASETDYWINLLGQSDYLNAKEYEQLHNECQELIKMLAATTKTSAPRQF